MSDRSTSSRGAATRVAILDRADHLFRAFGYQKTAVADIAHDLQMSPANIYRFFASKSAICEAICQRTLAIMSERAWAIARGPGTAEARLRTLFTTLQTLTLDLFFTETRMHDMVAAAIEEHWPTIGSFIRQIETAIRHIILDGQADGRFARLDPQPTAKLIHAMMIGFIHPRVIAECEDPAELPAMAAGMAELALRALRADETTDGS